MTFSGHKIIDGFRRPQRLTLELPPPDLSSRRRALLHKVLVRMGCHL